MRGRLPQGLAEFGPIDVLINAGGRRQNIATAEMPLETWQELIDLNLTSVFVCTKPIGGAMVERWQGRIINIASINAPSPAARSAAGITRQPGAMVQFTRATAADWARSA